jgi:hypothetical protein
MTNAQMQKAVYALIFQRHMVGQKQNDSYALHLAAAAANNSMEYILSYQKVQSMEAQTENWVWEIKANTKALARVKEEYSQGL